MAHSCHLAVGLTRPQRLRSRQRSASGEQRLRLYLTALTWLETAVERSDGQEQSSSGMTDDLHMLIISPQRNNFWIVDFHRLYSAPFSAR
jgi:hypothetical protein